MARLDNRATRQKERQKAPRYWIAGIAFLALFTAINVKNSLASAGISYNAPFYYAAPEGGGGGGALPKAVCPWKNLRKILLLVRWCAPT